MDYKIFKEEEVCANCKHFYPHYGPRGAYVINCGHCCYPRLKHRKLNNTCEYFEKKEAM